MTSASQHPVRSATPRDEYPSAAKPLAVGFVVTFLSTLLAVAGVLLATGNDDWLLLVIGAGFGLLVGLLQLAEGIYHLVRAVERRLARP